MEPLISVIIPVYNVEPYLARCLDSIRNNTYRNLEILCVDDGSTDNSLSILRAFAEKDPRIIVITKENGGVSSARNAGLDRMTGEYVTFVDPDDYVHPQYIALLYQTLMASGEANVAFCGFRRIEETDAPISTQPIPFNESELTFVSCRQIFKNHRLRSYCVSWMLSSSLAGKVRFRDNLSYSEDSVYFAELAEQASSFRGAVNPNTLYYYLQRENSLMHQADIAGRMKAAKVFVKKALLFPEKEQIFLDQAIKCCLSTRYLASHILLDRGIVRRCNLFLRACQRKFGRTKVYSGREKLINLTVILAPGLYWLYRSVTEPYMWKWERVQRKKRREAKE